MSFFNVLKEQCPDLNDINDSLDTVYPSCPTRYSFQFPDILLLVSMVSVLISIPHDVPNAMGRIFAGGEPFRAGCGSEQRA